MGRGRREVGSIASVDGCCMTFLSRDQKDGGELWSCGKCGAGVSITPACAGCRGHRKVFQRHLGGCKETDRVHLGGARLCVAGEEPLVLVARRVFPSARCEAVLAELPEHGYDYIALGGGRILVGR
jgi:hypothetical protein